VRRAAADALSGRRGRIARALEEGQRNDGPATAREEAVR
jgi:hypothetical protein